jgi:hypothetical protein
MSVLRRQIFQMLSNDIIVFPQFQIGSNAKHIMETINDRDTPAYPPNKTLRISTFSEVASRCVRVDCRSAWTPTA